jgi:hypothetical protein
MLTEDQELQILRDEMLRRGKDPDLAIQRRKIAWPIGSNGYFIKRDGKFYNPSENQGGFVHSNAYFSAYIGPRGSGKSAGGAQKGLLKLAQHGGDGAVLNPDFTNFKDSTWPEQFQRFYMA